MWMISLRAKGSSASGRHGACHTKLPDASLPMHGVLARGGRRPAHAWRAGARRTQACPCMACWREADAGLPTTGLWSCVRGLTQCPSTHPTPRCLAAPPSRPPAAPHPSADPGDSWASGTAALSRPSSKRCRWCAPGGKGRRARSSCVPWRVMHGEEPKPGLGVQPLAPPPQPNPRPPTHHHHHHHPPGVVYSPPQCECAL